MHPSVPQPVRIVLLLATIASLLAMPFPTLAAPRGTEVRVALLPLVEEVSPGRTAAFQAVVINDGNATINAASFTATLSAGVPAASGPTGCPGATTALSCQLGTLTAGQVVTLTFVLTAPDSGAVVFDGEVAFDSAQNNQNAASRDTVLADEASITVRPGGDFVGVWLGPNMPLDESTMAVGPGNSQSTRVRADAAAGGYPVMVEEINQAVCGSAGFGAAVDLDIAGGAAIQPYLEVTLTYDRTAAQGKSAGNVDVVHQTDGGACPDLTSGCEGDEVNCFDAAWQGSGQNRIFVVTVRLPSNGVIKGV